VLVFESLRYGVALRVRCNSNVCRFELFEFARKLVLIGVLTAVSPSSQAYLNVAHTVSFFSMIVFANCRPFVEPRLDRCVRG
jgi:hypothetical protein